MCVCVIQVSTVKRAICHSRDLSCGIKTTSFKKKDSGSACLIFMFSLFFLSVFSFHATKRCCITFSKHAAFLLAVSGLCSSTCTKSLICYCILRDFFGIFMSLENWQKTMFDLNLNNRR